MSLATGYVLQNRYRIAKLVGQGGFGAVYRAWDLTLRQPVAVKENIGSTVAAQNQFEREAIILAALRHPGLPRVIDHFIIPSQGQYLVMDFVEGKSLEELLNERGGPLSETEILPWMRQVCDALDYLHRLTPPVIHRDIKPQNIIITPGGRALLVDFGISKVYDPSTSTTVGARAVTPGYSAPENYGTGRTNPRSDIYALGATIYTLLTGQVPPDSVDLMTGNDTLMPLETINPAVSLTTVRAVTRAMELDNRKRTQDVAMFQAVLSGVDASSGSAQATPVGAGTAASSVPTPVTSVPSAPRRSPAWAWLLGAVAVVLAVWLAFRVVDGGGDTTPTPFPETPIALAGADTPEPTAASREVQPEATEPIIAAVDEPLATDEPAATEEPPPEPTEESAAAAASPRIAPELTIETDTSRSMVELLSGDPNFSIFVEALANSELSEPDASAPGTLFVPPNAAFEAMDQAQLQAWLADPTGDMARIVQHHLFEFAVSEEDLALSGSLLTTAGEPIILSEFNIIAPDVQASNGVIHVIDAVQVPPTVANAVLAEQLLAQGIPVLRVWVDNLRQPALSDIEQAFENEYGVDLLIEVIDFGDIRSLLLTAAPAGKGPDILVGAHDWLGELVSAGLVSPIDLGDKAVDFAPAALQAFTYNGDLYGMPSATENVGLFINTDLVAECPATWTEVRQTSARLHGVDPDQFGFVRMIGDAYHFYPIQSAFGGYVFGRDADGSYNPNDVGIGSEGSIAAGQWLQRMVSEGLQPPAMDWDAMHAMFESGQAAMIITGPWAVSRIAESGVPYTICDIPDETANGAPFLGAQGFMISAFARDPLLAQIFLTEFVATSEVMQAFYDIDLRAPAYLPVLATADDPHIAAFASAGANAQPMPAIPEMSSVWEAWAFAIALVQQGSETAANAFTNAQQQIETAISGG